MVRPGTLLAWTSVPHSQRLCGVFELSEGHGLERRFIVWGIEEDALTMAASFKLCGFSDVITSQRFLRYLQYLCAEELLAL